jgi:hypothetical protein
VTPVALLFDEYGGGHRLPFLCGNNKKHRAESDGQGQWQRPISIAEHHGAKIHFFRAIIVKDILIIFAASKIIQK